jgi:hypothetical protein
MADKVAEMLAELESLEPPELRERWTRTFGRPAPRRMSRDLLLRALAYRVQEQAAGGLSKAARKRLAGLANPDANHGRPSMPTPRLKPGTRLVREWRGEVHQVAVLDDGFEHRGARYDSLSRIARAITGTRWSGPLFFGLRKAETRSDEVQDAR